jgi:lipoprotein-releasing system permease protein
MKSTAASGSRRYRQAIFIALRHLTTRKRQSSLSILGTATGAMILVLTLSMTEGLMDSIIRTVLEITPPVTLKGKAIRQPVPDRLFDADLNFLLRRTPPSRREDIRPFLTAVKLAGSVDQIIEISPFVEVRVLVRSRGRFKSVRFLGVDPRVDDRVVALSTKLIQGNLTDFDASPDGILLGYRIARDLNLVRGDRVQIVSPAGINFQGKVTGLIKSGLKTFDESFGIISLRKARLIAGLPESAADGLRIGIRDLDASLEVAQRLTELTGYTGETWFEQNRNMLDMFERNNRITLFFVLFTFVVAGFGIRNMLVTLVLEKTRDIAILRAMGFSRRVTMSIFILEGFLIGLIGTVIGLTLGLGLILLIRSIPASYGEAAIIASSSIPMAIKGWFFSLTAGFNLIISLLAGFSPARRAAGLEPVAIIRGEK